MTTMKTTRALLVLPLLLTLSGCGYNTIQQKDEAVNAAWSQVLNVYKRRADLGPGFTGHHQDAVKIDFLTNLDRKLFYLDHVAFGHFDLRTAVFDDRVHDPVLSSSPASERAVTRLTIPAGGGPEV